MSEVLHGTGKPRLKYLTTDSVEIGQVKKVYDGYFALNNPSNLSSALINHGVYATNPNGEETWARITDVDATNGIIYHTAFSNIFPAVTALVTVKHLIYDLPYAQNNLIEVFTPDFIVHPMKAGKRITDIKGWWYSVVLDYTRKIKALQIEYFAPLFDKTRDYEVYLYPRLDNPDVYYSVELDPDTELKLAQKPFHKGHRLFAVKLNGIERMDSVSLGVDVPKLSTELGEPIVTENLDFLGV